MTDKEQKALRTYCAFLLTEYGFQFSPNDPVMPALFAIHKEVEVLRQSNRELTSYVQEAASKINPVTYHFNYRGESWKFQMGIALKWISIGLLLALLSSIAVWYWSMKKEIDQVRLLNETFEITATLNKRVKKQDGYYVIDFTEAKVDTANYFTEFQKLNSKTVRVFLGRVRKQ